MDNSATIERYGDEPYQALMERTIDPLTDREPAITIEDAYQIQLRMIQRRLDAGETVVGKKIGVTSKVVMDMLKVNQPDFGQMTSGMVFNEGEPIRTDTMIAPRAEAEVAFVLKRDLMGPGVTAADVLRATDCVMPCFEIVDSRIKDWKIKIQDTVADNASCGVLTLGGMRKTAPASTSRSPAWCWRRTARSSHSTGAAVQGSPVNAVAWLANTQGRLGIGLKGGRSDPVRIAVPAGPRQGGRQPELQRRRPRQHLGPIHLSTENIHEISTTTPSSPSPSTSRARTAGPRRHHDHR